MIKITVIETGNFWFEPDIDLKWLLSHWASRDITFYIAEEV